VDKETFDKSQDYSRAKSRFGFFSSTFGLVKNIAFIKYDLLPKLWSISGCFMSRIAPVLPSFMGGILTQSMIFFAGTQLLSTILSLPFDYYHHFILEEKYGFNKQTVKLWVIDNIKSFALFMVIGNPLAAAFFKIIDVSGDSFIFYIMTFILVVQLIAITIYPTLIQPLFNTLSPLEDGELKTAIEKLAKDHKFPLTELYVIDGSKRSSHSNAYFTGLPWKKSIVLFDTLIEHSTVEETVAVLAHEIGHWKLNHIPKSLLFAQVHLFLVFSMFSGFINNNSLYSSFGFRTIKPTIIGFVLFSDIFTPVEGVMQFAHNLMSRTFEYQADNYAVDNGYSNVLARSLLKMFTENLGSIDADWLYSAYHHSHPILPERLKGLGYVSEEKVGDVKVNVVETKEAEKTEENEEK
jgi:STE24 endopeptidase